MIHVYALDPQVVATWGRRPEYRYIVESFGLGTPRAMLELPKLRKWERAVLAAAQELGLSPEDLHRVVELVQLFREHKHTRSDALYDDLRTWLENAEREHGRKPFRAIIAASNPRNHPAVLVGERVGPDASQWACSRGTTIARSPAALAGALASMLVHSRELHLVDPHFGFENRRHRTVLEALMNVLADHEIVPERVCIHCSGKATLAFFEAEAKAMAPQLPSTITLEFVRWKQRMGKDRLHNRYVLTDLGGVMLGTGLDAGAAGETDDLALLDRAQYTLRWAQYARNDGTFEEVDVPAPVRGTKPRRVVKAKR